MVESGARREKEKKKKKNIACREELTVDYATFCGPAMGRVCVPVWRRRIAGKSLRARPSVAGFARALWRACYRIMCARLA
jgi:hypothetical protein